MDSGTSQQLVALKIRRTFAFATLFSLRMVRRLIEMMEALMKCHVPKDFDLMLEDGVTLLHEGSVWAANSDGWERIVLTHVPAGDYELEWDGFSEEWRLVTVKDGKETALTQTFSLEDLAALEQRGFLKRQE